MPGLGRWYVEIEKQGFWRGVPHTWVNRYVLSGTTNPTTGDATAVINQLKAIENTLYPEVSSGHGAGFVEGRAYGVAGGPPIASVPYNPSLNAGTATGFAGPPGTYSTLQFQGTLENCLDVRMPLTGLNSRGKPVYCRKYYRGIIALGEAGSISAVSDADIALIAPIVVSMQTGLAGTGYTVVGTSGRAASGPPTAQKFISNHQVPRGKKRAVALVAGAAYSSGVVAGAALAGASADATGSTSGEGRDIFGDRPGLFAFPPRL